MEIYLYLREYPTDAAAPKSGPMKAVRGLAAGLAAAGAKVSILCEGPKSVEIQEAGYRVRCFQNRVLPLRFVLAEGLKQFLGKNGQRCLVILNGLFNPSLYSVAEWLRSRRIRYVAASHSSYHPALFDKNPYIKWPYWYLFERPFLAGASGIQVLDIRQQAFVASLGVERPFFEVANGFMLDEAPLEEQLEWTTAGSTRLMYFGRLDAYTKGLDLLVRAFGRLAEAHSATLTLQGPPSHQYATLLRAIARSKRKDAISIIGEDFQSPAPEILSQYDIVCFPSRYEGFGLAALEAMIAGRVLLVSRTSGIAPHVEASGCGLLVDPDATAIERALNQLLRMRSRWREMGLSGRRYAFANLRWDAIGRTALAHYSALMTNGMPDDLPMAVAPVEPTVSSLSQSI